jgi:peptide-methionine (S)-S-oxide reductase
MPRTTQSFLPLAAVLAMPILIGLFCIWEMRPGPASAEESPTTQPTTQESEMLKNAQTATFAAGCFWGVQSTFEKVPGVISTRVGYTGGTMVSPTYQDVCTDQTGHAEAIEIKFDPSKVTYQQLLNTFFENHDPTTMNRQGPDEGTQYRSVVFYHSPEQQKEAVAEIDRRNKSGEYVGPIVTQVVAAGPFYAAEDYHQHYYDKQGVTWSCHFGNGKK